ncbi:MAG: OmpA family protein [Saprospiraceae bacterium]
MKNNIFKDSKQFKFRSYYQNLLKSIVMIALFMTAMQFQLTAQTFEYTKPSWWIGASAGANLNFNRGSTQELNAEFTSPVAFHNGFGAGLFLAPLVEYQAPGSMFGFGFQAGYDSRKGKFDQVITPCDCPADLSTKLSYITVEPTLKFAPFRSNFYLFGGPRVAFLIDNSFTYKLGINPAYPDQLPNPDVKGDLSNTNKTLLSMQIGAGYDIPVSSQNHQIQSMISPFVSFQPYFGQSPRSIETWNLTTVRVGAAIKFGRGKKIPVPAIIEMEDPKFKFTIISPKNIPVSRRVRETFPVLNYVYFDGESTEISDRYVLLNKNQVKDFKEDQLEVFKPKKLSGRSDREMVVYYNVLNILGDRMQKDPSSEIVLVGSSIKGIDHGKLMAVSVKDYLVNVFSIIPSRIGIEGRDKPKIPSEQPGGTLELDLLREGDQRVSIESNSPALLMEFQSGKEMLLKPIEINSIQEAPLDSYVSFNVEGATQAFTSWNIEVKDSKGKIQSFGPYYKDLVTIPGKTILGERPEGDFVVTMKGIREDGKIISQSNKVHMVLWKPDENEQGIRYSVIYEFNESKAVSIYEKYLTEVIAKKIPVGAKVIIHGHTDAIGDEVNNQKLSLARAMDVKTILSSSPALAGRSDITFETMGMGEDDTFAPFGNKFPEERAYNRTVIIDIIPNKER